VVGGINSYGLLLLVAAYYSLCPEVTSLGVYLARLLNFYVNYFNNMLYGIYYNGSIVTYHPLTMPLHYKYLVIIDPFNNQSNITASLYQFDVIRECFFKLLICVTSN